MSRNAKIGLVIIVLVGTALRMRGLFANTFHADEALFATWARLIAVWRDPLLADQIVDKPPLLFYLQALFYPLFGPVEWAARMPNFISSLLIILLAPNLYWKLFNEETGALITAALISLSPLLIQFSTTAYTDPLTSALILASLSSAVDAIKALKGDNPGERRRSVNRALLSGVLFGLALAAKYQALLVLPLLLGICFHLRWNRTLWTRWLIGAGVVVGLIILWDTARTASPGIAGAQLSSYGGVRLAWSWELWDRFNLWLTQWRYLLGISPLAQVILVLAILFWLYAVVLNDEYSAYDQLFSLLVLAYFLLHWLIAVPIWDRYLVLVAPYFAILISRMLWRAYELLSVRSGRIRRHPVLVKRLIAVLAGVFLLLQIPKLVSAYQGELPIGGQPGADKGAAQYARYLYAQPSGTVLYDHWYSWAWRYHLFDSGVFVSWFPSPQSVVEDLRVFGDGDEARFIALPKTGEALPAIRSLESAGYSLTYISIDSRGSGNIDMAIYQISAAN